MRLRRLVPTRSNVSLAAVVLGLLIRFHASGSQPLPEVERHVDRVVARHSEFLLTDHGTISARSFTSNRCTPEQGGFFGATFGNPIILTYGFELETTPDADTTAIVEIIKTTIVNQILISTFPGVCASAPIEQWNNGQVWGYQFMGSVILSSDPCSLQHLQSNKCESYESSLVVFGTDTLETRQKISSLIQDTIASSAIKNSDSAIVSVLPMMIQREKVSMQSAVAHTPPAGGSSKMSPSGIALSVLAAVIGTVALATYQWRRYKTKQFELILQKRVSMMNNVGTNDDDAQFIFRTRTATSDDSLDSYGPSKEPWGLRRVDCDQKIAECNRWRWVV